ncbi:MAG: hypothetical protein KF884_06540 [Fimbriimonadaceae bacterium]|nr:hypothetical protein [Fimbriimonadaceae bacterium]QYK57208.1 MAG: hypothetical protein KF884_06540 [Fimbriimonadaceae bacterium]
MATPPPFTMPPPPSEGSRPGSGAGKTCLIAGIVVLGLCVVLILVSALFFRNVWGQVSATASCMGTFEAVHGAMLAYSMENDDRLPLAANWQQSTEKYYSRLHEKLKGEGMPKDFLPAAPGEPLQCKWEGRSTGIAYNLEIAGAKVQEIETPEKAVLLFETDTIGVSQSKKFEERPKANAPRIFYNERDWIVYYVEGNKNPFERDSTTEVDFNIDPKDALEPDQGPQPKGD